MQVITSIDQALSLAGQELGVGPWVTLDQGRIDAFADCTEDHQWIHVDVQRAVAESRYGGPIAHGFLTLSLLPAMSKANYRVESKMGINYGLNKVRFLSAVVAGSRIRVRSDLLEATKVDESTLNLIVRHTVDIENVERPAAVADLISRYIF